MGTVSLMAARMRLFHLKRMISFSTLILCGWNILGQEVPSSIEQHLDRIAGKRLLGDSASALLEFERLESSLSPPLLQENHLDYLKAVLLAEAGQKEAACHLFRDLEARFSLRENLLLHLIDCSVGQPLEKRQPLFEEFLSLAKGHPKRAKILFHYAELLRDSGLLVEAKERFDEVWRPRGELWQEAALEHALLHLRQGDSDAAIKDLENLISRKDRGDVAHRAVVELGRLQSPDRLTESQLQKRVRVYMNQRDTEPARMLLQQWLKRFPGSSSSDENRYLLGRSYVLDENYPAAIQAYEMAYQKSSPEPWGVRCKYLVANTALRMDDFELARATYEQVIKNHPTDPYAVDARFNLADTYRWLQEPVSAEKVALQAIRFVPAAEKRRFYYFLARLYLEQQRHTESLVELAKLEPYSSRNLPSGVTREEIFYLKGLNLEQLGRTAEGRIAFEKAIEHGSNYFAQLAAARLGRNNEKAGVEDSDWLNRLLKPRQFSREPPPPIGASDYSARTAELLFLRLYDEAAVEIRRGGSALFRGRRTDYLFNRAYYSAQGGQGEESLTAAELLERTAFSRTSWDDYPRIIKTLLYPRHYSQQILDSAATHNVDPDLMLAIMKQESRFAPDAFSPATARGLMQFMVPTARQLSSELGLDFQNPEQLFRSSLSIELGGFYLRKLLNRFGDSMEKALAAYNGGPDNAARWDDKLSWKRPDLFVVNIGFRETKLYVLKVMGNYYTYRSLYGNPQSSALPASWLAGGN